MKRKESISITKCEHRWMLIPDETGEPIAVCLKCEKKAKLRSYKKHYLKQQNIPHLTSHTKDT